MVKIAAEGCQGESMLLFIWIACQTTSEKQSAASITYYQDVLPILSQNCLRCHMGNGPGVGDFSDPETASQFAEVMLASIEDGRMPPPVSDPACHDYIDSEKMFITEESKEVIAKWIEAGKPIGDAADAPEINLEALKIEDPDITTYIPAPYTPTYDQPDSEGNEYRCFVLEHEHSVRT